MAEKRMVSETKYCRDCKDLILHTCEVFHENGVGAVWVCFRCLGEIHYDEQDFILRKVSNYEEG